MLKYNRDAMDFCHKFIAGPPQDRYILGRNIYSKAVVSQLEISGIIDDFTSESGFEGLPVLRSSDVPSGALVLNAAGGRSLTARSRLDYLGLRNLDYFAFLRLSGLPLPDLMFNEGFAAEYAVHREEYDWITSRLGDELSRDLLIQLVRFRRTLDIRHLEGLESRESEQYFEDFLRLRESGEVFIDIGCFDGANSIEFARLAPNYRAIHAFEPDPQNFEVCTNKLQSLRDVSLHNIGLSDKRETVKFSQRGAGSRLSSCGTVEVCVDRLDDLLVDSPTLVKIDIEGAEGAALSGAQRLISTAHPRLAIACYHRPGDFHRIPRLVLAIRDDYDIYLRHYTETIYETVMFFLPRHRKLRLA